VGNSTQGLVNNSKASTCDRINFNQKVTTSKENQDFLTNVLKVYHQNSRGLKWKTN
jgi:hypothetical protein